MLILGALISAFLYWRGLETVAIYLGAFCGLAGIFGLTGTIAARPFYYLWLGIAFFLGLVITPIIITLMYYLLVTPLALLMKAKGRDRLNLKKSNTDSYWTEITPSSDKEQYERQF